MYASVCRKSPLWLNPQNGLFLQAEATVCQQRLFAASLSEIFSILARTSLSNPEEQFLEGFSV